ncbi:MAG: SHOCT domain-containing protein [Acidimicrobiales bacterium]
MLRFEQVGFGPGGHPFIFFLLLVLVVGVVLVLLFTLVAGRSAYRRGGAAVAPGRGSGAMQILDERFARGEIDVDDYKVRRELITSHA